MGQLALTVIPTVTLTDPPDSRDLGAWLEWGSSAYSVSARHLEGIVREPTQGNPCPLSIRSTRSRWNDWHGTGLLVRDRTPSAVDVAAWLGSVLLAGKRGDHLRIVDPIRWWTAVISIAAWEERCMDLRRYPRQGWYSPADVALVRRYAPEGSLTDKGLRDALWSMCQSYKMLHPQRLAVACEEQLTYAYEWADRHAR